MTSTSEALNQPRDGYIRAKAQLYCRLGADVYRRVDALRHPPKSFRQGELGAVNLAMQQLADGYGLSASCPLTIPVEHSHAVARVLHFEVVVQAARRSDDGVFLDMLLCRHVVDGRRIALFNRVPR